MRFAAQARGTGGGFMAILPETNGFTVRAFDALRGGLRSRPTA